MRLEELTLATLTKAVETYLELAYLGARPRWVPDLGMAGDAKPESLLSLFQRETGEGERPRYSMRLGNRNYPFMKLVLQEHIVEGAFQFSVDTHDEMEVKPEFPDYDAWMAVRRFNRELKRKIEARFAEVGLATAAELRRAVAERCRDARGDGNDRSVLVVDDEEDLADAVATLLTSRGYAVTKAGDGRRALEVARAARPDLVLLDYELPEMDGLEVIAALRGNASTRDIPVLLCTASRIGVEEIRKADGFLAKPYAEGLLFRMVEHLIANTRRSSS